MESQLSIAALELTPLIPAVRQRVDQAAELDSLYILTNRVVCWTNIPDSGPALDPHGLFTAWLNLQMMRRCVADLTLASEEYRAEYETSLAEFQKRQEYCNEDFYRALSEFARNLVLATQDQGATTNFLLHYSRQEAYYQALREMAE